MTHDMRAPRPIGPAGRANAVPCAAPGQPGDRFTRRIKWLHYGITTHGVTCSRSGNRCAERHRGAIETMNELAASTVDKVQLRLR